jgi:hypothetical protein
VASWKASELNRKNGSPGILSSHFSTRGRFDPQSALLHPLNPGVQRSLTAAVMRKQVAMPAKRRLSRRGPLFMSEHRRRAVHSGIQGPPPIQRRKAKPADDMRSNDQGWSSRSCLAALYRRRELSGIRLRETLFRLDQPVGNTGLGRLTGDRTRTDGMPCFPSKGSCRIP